MEKFKIKFNNNTKKLKNSSLENQDEINLELSRTYFGGENNRRKSSDRRYNPDRRKNNTGQKKRNLLQNKILLIILINTLVLIVAFFLFIRYLKTETPQTYSDRDTSTENMPLEKKEPELKNVPTPMVPALSSEIGTVVLYDFENDDDGWGIPAWALNLRDHVAISSERSEKHSSNGIASLKVKSNFPEKTWSASLVEIQHFLNLENFDIISADVFFPGPKDKTLRGVIILTQGENWEFNEMSHSFRINPGEWTTIWADISENSVDWKKKKLDKYFKNDIRKIAIRVESTKTSYKGYIYIDNIRVSTKKAFFPSE